MSQRVYISILKELTECVTFKSVAKRFGVSTNTVARVCDMLNYTLYKLPEAISIDEFKGNSGGNKYQCILTNPINHKVLDVLVTREKDPDKATKLLKAFIEITKELNIEEYQPAITAYTNWFEYIINSKRTLQTGSRKERIIR